MHGAKAGRPPTTGKTSKKYVPEKIRKVYMDFLENEDLHHLGGEIARLRAELANIDIEAQGDIAASKAVKDIIDSIGKLIEKQHKIEHSDRYTITIRQLEVFVAKIVNAVDTACPASCQFRSELANAIEAVTRGEG
jgi:hypothetical protein